MYMSKRKQTEPGQSDDTLTIDSPEFRDAMVDIVRYLKRRRAERLAQQTQQP